MEVGTPGGSSCCDSEEPGAGTPPAWQPCCARVFGVAFLSRCMPTRLPAPAKNVDGLPEVIDWVADNGGLYPLRRLR